MTVYDNQTNNNPSSSYNNNERRILYFPISLFVYDVIKCVGKEAVVEDEPAGKT